MKRFFYLLLLILAGMQAVHAQNDVYVCTGADGATQYQNIGATKGCTKLDLSGTETSLPAPVRSTPDKGSPVVRTKPSVAPDHDRQRLLQNELSAEQSKLADLQGEYNGGEPERRGDERNYARYEVRITGMKDDIARTERNIEALQRELRIAR